jgi:RNA polymerase sigma factor (sigma-70 family)
MLRNVVRRLRRAVDPSVSGGLTDADLLRRWVSQRDEAAFEALLWRHAAAVLGVCRRVLHDAHEAEDATQAAFLALARKARSIGRRQAVAAWLYTVAYRTALRARARQCRAIPVLPRDLAVLPARPAEDPAWRDLRPVLDREVSQLPEKYRAPFVLCHLEGRTNEEAARELGCPVGTVLSRLARARQRLRDRLTRRGVTLGAGALAAALVAESATAAVSGPLVTGAVRAAVLAAAGEGLAGVVSTEVVALTEGVVRAMLLTKIKVVTAVAFGLVLLGGGGGVLTYRTAAGEPDGPPRDPPGLTGKEKAAPADAEKLKALLAQREKEIRDLQDRMKALEESLAEKTLRLESALLKRQEEADRAKAAQLGALAAEQHARKLAEAERDARKVAEDQAVRAAAEADRRRTQRAGPGPGPMAAEPIAGAGRADQVEQARDEVELLEAQVAVRRAQLRAAQVSLAPAHEMARAGVPTISRGEVAALEGQVEIRTAELNESEVRLTQARRRLARLTGAGQPAAEQQPRQLNQKAAELEKKLDALQKELDGLRREIRPPQPGRP